jgi:nitroimidazol reductase NimA-like FMN-containing flavoprotein (pyridoxamine 5'-phosphate oxidase superfamily)
MTAADPRPEDPALRAMAHGVLDANRYLVLGTAERDGRPRVSPVYFTHDGYRHLYWVSSPASTHSGNVAADSRVGIVVFDSSRPTKDTEAVYVTATAAEVAPHELVEACAAAFARVSGGARPFTPEELSGDADLRLYRAVVETAQVHVRGSHPVWGSGIDRRVTVQLG